LANQNARFGTTVVLAITTKGYFLPTGRLVRHMVEVPPTDATGLSQTSFVKTDQIVTIAKDRLEKRIGALPPEMLSEVESALKRHLSLT
jgi:mRNA-degrading endonuclease toxin of MazEF toxin-antitoxin module